MSCPHCVASTQKALEEIEGISNVTVNLDKNEASYDGDIRTAIIEEAINKIGFKITH